MPRASSVHKDLAPQRLNRLRELLQDHPVVRVEELCERLKVSPATIRRDLEALEEQGELRRVHGGAVAIGSHAPEPLFDDKAAIASREKQRIADKAVELIHARETVYLDGGSTVLRLARRLRDWRELTVVTNSFRAAQELSGEGPRLVFIGGEFRRLSQTVVGPLTRLMLDELRIDRAFLGTLGLSLDEGMTTSDPSEAYTKELVTQRAGHVTLLADSTKIGHDSFVRAGKLKDIDLLITDKKAGAKFIRSVRKLGVNVIQA